MAELGLYEVAVRGHKTAMKLSEEDAKSYGDAAKKVGSVKPAEAQPVSQPPYANDSSSVESEATPMQADLDDDEPAQKKAPARRNKAASADGEKS